MNMRSVQQARRVLALVADQLNPGHLRCFSSDREMLWTSIRAFVWYALGPGAAVYFCLLRASLGSFFGPRTW